MIFRHKIRLVASAALCAVMLGACTGEFDKANVPVPRHLVSKMHKLDMKETGAVFVRIFKQESELEVWKERSDGTYGLLEKYEICKWSGALGPKRKEGDRQAPEGFYTVRPGQMNPQSSYHLSFNIGYPNSFDRAYGRTGKHLMVHGACSSAGCYSMNDDQVEEIYALARDSFRGGQRKFNVHAFPFRMTPANMAAHVDNPNYAFWENLKEGYEHFNVTHKVPKVDVCGKNYVFNSKAIGARFEPALSCPEYEVEEPIHTLVQEKLAIDNLEVQAILNRLELKEQQDASREERVALRQERFKSVRSGLLSPVRTLLPVGHGNSRYSDEGNTSSSLLPVPSFR